MIVYKANCCDLAIASIDSKFGLAALLFNLQYSVSKNDY